MKSSIAALPIGLGLGRIGNFINGELWGRPTDLPWGMVFPWVDAQARHPSMLYEFFLEGILFFIILWVYSSRPRPTMAVSGLYLLCYGVFRFLVEFVREPDAHLGYLAFGWLTMGHVLTLPMIAVDVVLILVALGDLALSRGQVEVSREVTEVQAVPVPQAAPTAPASERSGASVDHGTTRRTRRGLRRFRRNPAGDRPLDRAWHDSGTATTRSRLTVGIV